MRGHHDVLPAAPLHRWGAGPGKKVAVIGLGGLGHLAVKLAHAMGAEVTVLSQSLKKMDDGLRLGADHYHATSDPVTFEQLAGTFDLIVNTVSAKLDLDAYLGLLVVNGAVVNVGAPAEPLSLNVFSLTRSRAPESPRTGCRRQRRPAPTARAPSPASRPWPRSARSAALRRRRRSSTGWCS